MSDSDSTFKHLQEQQKMWKNLADPSGIKALREQQAMFKKMAGFSALPSFTPEYAKTFSIANQITSRINELFPPAVMKEMKELSTSFLGAGASSLAGTSQKFKFDALGKTAVGNTLTASAFNAAKGYAKVFATNNDYSSKLTQLVGSLPSFALGSRAANLVTANAAFAKLGEAFLVTQRTNPFFGKIEENAPDISSLLPPREIPKDSPLLALLEETAIILRGTIEEINDHKNAVTIDSEKQSPLSNIADIDPMNYCSEMSLLLGTCFCMWPSDPSTAVNALLCASHLGKLFIKNVNEYSKEYLGILSVIAVIIPTVDFIYNFIK